MVDFLFALGQVLCVLGLLYGAYLCITFAPEEKPSKAAVHFDPITTHAWEVPAESVETRLRRVA